MANGYELVIRGGTIYDGTGADPYVADIGVSEGTITAVAPGLGRGDEELDASDLIVTPGFVDIHTHYDGQVTWESSIRPSSAHGVTTIVTGNCGVGFAPARKGDHEALIELMSGVEDIPEVVMAEGLEWNWDTFAEYLDAVDARPHDMDVAAMVPHSALRVFVMGDRAMRREDANAEDITRMAELVKEALAAGAIGFGTSRAVQQKSTRGEPIPTVRAAEDELFGILSAMAQYGSGVFQALSDWHLYENIEGEFAMFRRLVEATGCSMSFTLNEKPDFPNHWREVLAPSLSRRATPVSRCGARSSHARRGSVGPRAHEEPVRRLSDLRAVRGAPVRGADGETPTHGDTRADPPRVREWPPATVPHAVRDDRHARL